MKGFLMEEKETTPCGREFCEPRQNFSGEENSLSASGSESTK
jgi:hypothetical protein